MAKPQTETSLARLLAARVNAYRERTGMSVKDLASKAKVSTATIYSLSREGGKPPSELTVQRIEAAIRDEDANPHSSIDLDPVLRAQVEVILQKATTKGALDRLIQHIFRTVEGESPDKVRGVAERLIYSHLSRYAGDEKAREVLELFGLLREKTD